MNPYDQLRNAILPLPKKQRHDRRFIKAFLKLTDNIELLKWLNSRTPIWVFEKE